jgi:hypothetical protein
MKYIMLEQIIGDIVRKIPIIFPDILVHDDVARVLIIDLCAKNLDTKVVSAGKIVMKCLETYDKSTTLKLQANKIDKDIINSYDYLHGIGF